MKKRFIFIIGILMAVLICFTGAMDCKAEVKVTYYGDDGNVEWYIDRDPDYAYSSDTLHVKPSEGSDGIMNDYLDPISGCAGLYSGWSNKIITKVEIEEGFVHIGDYAFCSDAVRFNLNQNTVVIPDTVKSIGEGAFARNTELFSVDIPDSVEKIGKNAFDLATIIKCNYNSYALEYAKENGYNYIIKNVKLKVNKSNINTTKDKKVRINVLDKKNNNKYDGNLQIKISNSNVVKQNSDGTFDIIGYGKSTITFISGKAKVSCKINSIPVCPKLKSAKSLNKKSVKLVWDNKNVPGTAYFRIYISQDKKFKKGVRKEDINNLLEFSYTKYKNNYTIKGLKSKKTYYVRIRPYVNVDGKKIWGNYSKTLKVKVK